MKKIAILILFMANLVRADTFGVTTVGTTTTVTFSTYNVGNVTSSYTHTAGTGEIIDSISLYLLKDQGTSVDVAIYTVSGGVLASRVAGPYTLARPASDSWVHTTNMNFSMTNGTVYSIGICNSTGDMQGKVDATGSNDLDQQGAGTCGTTWNHTAYLQYKVSAFAWYHTTASAPDIDSLVWVPSDTLTHTGRVQVICWWTNSADSLIYWYDTDSTFAGATRFGKNTGTSPQTENVTGLANNDWYRIWALAYAATLGDSTHVDTKTAYVAPTKRVRIRK